MITSNSQARAQKVAEMYRLLNRAGMVTIREMLEHTQVSEAVWDRYIRDELDAYIAGKGQAFGYLHMPREMAPLWFATSNPTLAVYRQTINLKQAATRNLKNGNRSTHHLLAQSPEMHHRIIARIGESAEKVGREQLSRLEMITEVADAVLFDDSKSPLVPMMRKRARWLASV